MGMSANAELIFGIPVEPYKPESDEPTLHVAEGEDDWRELGSEVLEYRPYGDYSEMQAILTVKYVSYYAGYSYEAARLPAAALEVRAAVVVSAQAEADRLGLDVDFAEAGWYLVASYG